MGPPHDVYGLGVTLYTLFAGGGPPYDIPPSASIAALRRLQMEERPKALGARIPDLDVEVERALTQALAVNATERPAAGQLVLAVKRARARGSATAPHDRPRPKPSVAPWRLAVAGVSLALVGLLTRLRKERGRGGTEEQRATANKEGS